MNCWTRSRTIERNAPRDMLHRNSASSELEMLRTIANLMKSHFHFCDIDKLRYTSALYHVVLVAAVAVLSFAYPVNASGQTPARGPEPAATAKTLAPSGASGLLRELNTSLVNLTKEVTPAVVQITVTLYGPIESSSHTGDVALFARQHAIGSGVILDPNGYIITNAHVVESAQRIRVTLNLPAAGPRFNLAATAEHRILEAKLVGIDKDTDLAVLKVDAHDLPFLSLATSRAVYPGEMVLAVGSPEGLQSSCVVIVAVHRTTPNFATEGFCRCQMPCIPFAFPFRHHLLLPRKLHSV